MRLQNGEQFKDCNGFTSNSRGNFESQLKLFDFNKVINIWSCVWTTITDPLPDICLFYYVHFCFHTLFLSHPLMQPSALCQRRREGRDKNPSSDAGAALPLLKIKQGCHNECCVTVYVCTQACAGMSLCLCLWIPTFTGYISGSLIDWQCRCCRVQHDFGSLPRWGWQESSNKSDPAIGWI